MYAIANVTKGSLQEVATRNGVGITQQLVSSVEVIVLFDNSASMAMTITINGERTTRYVVACRELAKLQADYAGKIALIEFNSNSRFVPGGIPSEPSMCTDLAKVLDFASVIEGSGKRLIVISDGEPDNEIAALKTANKFVTTCIDTIYIGRKGGAGEGFLRKLARNGGQHHTTKQQGLLGEPVRLLLEAGK